MTDPLNPAAAAPHESSPVPPISAPVSPPIAWQQATRQTAFEQWLQAQSATHQLLPQTCRLASADASFRRYFRVQRCAGGDFIVMDAPPELEDNSAFVHVAALMQEAGVHVPQILAWDRPQGFMLLSDLGQKTLLQSLCREGFAPNLPRYQQAIETLVQWQLASKPDVLPTYDAAVLRRELQLFPDWYVGRHLQIQLTESQHQIWQTLCDRLIERNLAAPQVYVHRDFMPRNLMVDAHDARLGVLDFQDALYGPITYDIASLMRDAFWSWDEDAVLDVSVRYWQLARQKGLIQNGPWGDWHSDFAGFYAAVEWMGLQRHLKVLGIFARLTLRDGKAAYLADTPRFVQYVRHTASRYKTLAPLLQILDEVEGVQPSAAFSFGALPGGRPL